MNAPRRLPPEALAEFDEWAAGVFDESSLGMLRVSLEQTVVACNRTAAKICGLRTLEGMSIRDLLIDQDSLEVMQVESLQRRQGRSTEYDVNVLHFPDHRRVPVRVTGMPVIASNGEVLGSLAIVRSLELEQRIQRFEDAILQAQGADQIFAALCDQTRPLLNFDFSSFSIYSRNGKHSRMLLSYDPERQVQIHKRWYPVSGALAQWVQVDEVQVIDLAELPARFPELRDDQTMQGLFAAGYVKLLRYPVKRGGQVIASFTCLSRSAEAFGETEVATIKALPIDKALLIAVHALENAELQFRFGLIRDMFICRTPETIAEAAVNNLARQYGWESVEIYSLDQANRKIRLLKQAASSPEYLLDEFFSMPLGKGVVGYVCQQDRDVLIHDITCDPQFKDVYVPLRRATRSELCMPIRVNGRVSAVLNIEDRRVNAFSDEEQENLRSLLDEIGGLFGAVWDKALIASAFELTPSVVLIADLAGNIIQYNSAATSLLGFSGEELMGTPLTNYFVQPDVALALFKASQVAGIETGLKLKNGGVLPALVGSRELDGFGAWVISARDLTNQKRIAELEGLRHVYREIAAQTKTPLSLAYSWLQRLHRQSETLQPGAADVLQKALAQLKKVDITYERLALYGQETGSAGYNEILLNAGELLKRTIANFPAELLSVSGLDRKDLYVRGDAFEIEFAVESTLSYLIRFLPGDEKVSVAVTCPADRLLVQVEAPFPSKPDCPDHAQLPPEEICQTIREMALGAEIIGKFMQHHRGTFRQVRAGARLRFELDFPLAMVEV